MKISVITPSYQNSDWLKQCVRSVADQGSALREHIIQDAGSTDGTRDWLSKEPGVRAFFEKDDGMYDAINRGFDRAQGEICGYLNCDEQYLPGALARVSDFFAHHPQVEAVVGDAVIVDSQARYLCSRLCLTPKKWGTWVRFPVVTSSFFFRREIWMRQGVRFDSQWKVFGDMFFVLQLVQRRVHFQALPFYLSAFFDHGGNLCLRADPAEIRRRHQATPRIARVFYFPLFWLYWFKVLVRQGLRPSPFSYAVYLPGQKERVSFQATRPSHFWAGRSRWSSLGVAR